MEERIGFGVILLAPSAHERKRRNANVDLQADFQASWRGGRPVDRDRNTGAGTGGDLRARLLRFFLPLCELPE